jgi:hypothetical protein
VPLRLAIFVFGLAKVQLVNRNSDGSLAPQPFQADARKAARELELAFSRLPSRKMEEIALWLLYWRIGC